MKKLDSQNIFSVFFVEQDTHNTPQAPSNTFILFGTVIKAVENFYILDQMYQIKYEELYNSMKEKIKLKYFLGLMKYLNRIDLLSVDTAMHLEDEFGGQAIKYALEEMLQFFEQVERYEECIIVKKYFDIFFDKKLV
jgi:hypothetical protein